ncbi:MAG TPA: hypothetical protein VL856_19035 [Acidimicrobiia bacterium]|jgi:hypothetical protein|nr:hypothetical protein [Acidimicrobiia bacterium]
MNANTNTEARPWYLSLPVLLLAIAVPIAAWIVHLGATSALVHEQCAHSSVEWVMHGLTAITALICLGCALIGVAAWRRPSLHFLGVLIVAVALTNLLVIVWEGSYTAFLSPCR